MTIRNRIRYYIDAPLTHQMVMDVLEDYNRPNDKISELIQRGDLIALRRGLYIPGPDLDLSVPDRFVIANHLRGPSYVSLETALSYWNAIPERVYEISSITLQSTHTYDTPIGRFTYRHARAPYYAFGLTQATITPRQVAVIATVEKAICDKIIFTPGVNLRSRSQTLDFLIEDLRIDEEILSGLDTEQISSWIPDAQKQTSLQMLVNSIQSL